MANTDPVIFSITDDAPDGKALITVPGGVGLYRRTAALEIAMHVGHGFTAKAQLKGCFVRLGANGDSFLNVLIPGAQDSEGFDVGFAWDSVAGVSFAGGAALEATIPIRARLPFVSLDALHVILTPQIGASTSIGIELSADIGASLLGVIAATVQRIGVQAQLYLDGAPPAGAIAVGPLGATFDFKPPTGAGLSLNVAGILNGGGFLSIDVAKGQYAGVLSINLLGMGITAIGIINTKPSFSLFAIISANFEPVGIDIGFGFTINAVGGLLGVNRSADLKALADSVRTNAISSVMFPSDPVANAPRILSDLERMFPRTDGEFLIGPMIKMGWGKPAGMISISLGIIIEVPTPRIAILGILKVLVPPLEEALLRIQVNFIGSIDFSAQFLRFDASLFDSRMITYSLDGDMVVRLRWGNNATFVVSAGGFNPRYVPAADLDIAPMRRISINYLPTKDNPRLRADSYYAATSNTLQHGARIDLYAAAMGFGIKGFLGYDLLLQLSPLHFEAEFSGNIAVIAADEELMSLGLDLLFAGPSPFHVKGNVSFRLLFIKVRVGLDETFGSPDAPALPTADVAAAFRLQLKNPRNWSAILPGQGQLLVQLRAKLEIKDGEILAHPSATLEFSERAIPLQVKLQRFGAATPKAEDFFDITGMTAGSALTTQPVRGEFAPAQFFELSNDQKFAAPAFQEFVSGVRADPTALARFSKAVTRDIGYEDGVQDTAAEDGIKLFTGARYNVDVATARATLGGSAVARSDVFRERTASLATGREVQFSKSGYRVVDADSMQPNATIGALDNHVGATQAMQQLIAVNPALSGRLLVVPTHDLV